MTLKEKYPLKSNCFDLDEYINNIMTEIVVLRQQANQNTQEINKLEAHRTALELYFKGKKCRDEIEMKRIKDSASTISNFATLQEKDIIPKKNKQQITYIIIGGVVLLTSLILFIKNKK